MIRGDIMTSAAAKDEKADGKEKEESKTDEAKKADGEAMPAEGDTAAEGGGKKRPNIKKIALFAGLPLLILVGGGVGAYFAGFIGHHGEAQLECGHVKEGDKDYAACAEQLAKAEAGKAPGVFIPIPDMIVNLSSNSRQPRFLKISLKVELDNPEEQKRFEDIQPRVIDQFQTYLRELRVEDLRGSSGMYRMKIELLNRVRAAAPGMSVRDVLFQEILIQ